MDYSILFYLCTYISRIYNILKNEKYVVGPYNVFTIYEPKERRIVSQNMQDKLVNHLVSRFILYPAILPSLEDFNVASRKNMGMKKGLELYQKYRNYFNCKYGTYYILKCDISKFFASINHDILKEKLHIKGVIRYQDDFLLFHQSKQYLKYCLEEFVIRIYVETD